MINQQTELETADNNYWVDMNESLQVLKENEHFKKVIENGYMKQKALHSVSLLAVPAIKRNGERPDVIEDLVAISNLQYFLQMVENLGATVPDDQEDDL